LARVLTALRAKTFLLSRKDFIAQADKLASPAGSAGVRAKECFVLGSSQNVPRHELASCDQPKDAFDRFPK
jgi:hypothetical protein